MSVLTALDGFHPLQPRMCDLSRGVEYREERPSPVLTGIIECFWELRASCNASPFTGLGVPDGCVDWVFGSSSFRRAGLTALLSSSVSVAIAPSTWLFGLRFLPLAMNLVTGYPPGAIYDKRYVLSDLWDDVSISELEQRIFEAGDFSAKTTVAEAWLCARIGCANYEPPARLLACLGRIYAAHGGLSIAHLARSEGMSERHLLRLFHSEMGLGPKSFSRVVRFQHVLARLVAAKGDHALNLALDAGYYDQAHFIHDFRALCGTTPAGLLR